MAYKELDVAGRTKQWSHYDRIVDVMEEIMRVTFTTRSEKPLAEGSGSGSNGHVDDKPRGRLGRRSIPLLFYWDTQVANAVRLSGLEMAGADVDLN